MGKKDKGICPQMAAMEEDRKWETRGDMDALMRITEVKKDAAWYQKALPLFRTAPYYRPQIPLPYQPVLRPGW